MRARTSQSVPDIDFATLDLLPYGIIVVDQAGTIVYYNEREPQIAGRARREVVGRNFFTEVAPCTQVAAFHGRFDEVMAARVGVVRFRFRFPFPNQPRDVAISLTPFVHGEAVLCLITVADLTEQEVVRTHILAGERFRAFGQVAGGVAHNFKNMLFVIAGNAELLAQQVVTPEGQTALRRIERAVQDSSAMVARIARILSPAEPAAMRPVDLAAVVREAVMWTRDGQPHFAPGKQVTFDEQLGPQPLWVQGIEGELRESFMNLLKNAAEAIPAEGTVTVGAAAAGGEVVVTIRDTGTGMSPDTLARVFQPLFTTKGQAGTGLGLATTYATIQRHQGQIAVESALGEGSTFVVTLPAAPGPA